MKKPIGIEFRIVSHLLRRKLEQSPIFAETDRLTGMNGWVIGFLFDHKNTDIFQKDIEAACRIRRSTATVMLQTMEANGLITRETVPYDARLKKILLTNKAESLHESVRAEIERIENQLVKGVSDEELDCFYRVMEKFKKNLE